MAAAEVTAPNFLGEIRLGGAGPCGQEESGGAYSACEAYGSGHTPPLLPTLPCVPDGRIGNPPRNRAAGATGEDVGSRFRGSGGGRISGKFAFWCESGACAGAPGAASERFNRPEEDKRGQQKHFHVYDKQCRFQSSHRFHRTSTGKIESWTAGVWPSPFPRRNGLPILRKRFHVFNYF